MTFAKLIHNANGLALAVVRSKPGKVHKRDRIILRRMNNLGRLAARTSKTCAQNFMTAEHLINCIQKGRRDERPLDMYSVGHSACRSAGRQLLKEPQVLL